MIPGDERIPPRTWLYSTAKGLVELGLVWSAVGYISLRTFCNLHDVPLIASLGVERYLQEAYALLVRIVVPNEDTSLAFLIIIIVLAISSIAWPLTRMRLAGMERRLQDFFGERAVSLSLFVAVLASAFGFGRINLALMHLSKASLIGPMHAPSEDSGNTQLYLTLLISILIWVAWFISRPRDFSSARLGVTRGYRVLRGLLGLFGSLTMFLVPVMYGASFGDRDFYIVRIQIQDVKEPVLAMRIFESANQMVYWFAADKIGHIQALPISKILSVDYLCSGNIAPQVQKASQGTKAPACN